MALSILYHFSLSLGKKNIHCDSEACDWSAEGCMYGRTRVWAQAHHAYFLTILAACFSASSGHSGNFFLLHFSICVTTFGFNKSFPWVIFCRLHGFYLRRLVEEDKTLGLPILDTEHKQLKAAAGWLAELEDPDHLVSRRQRQTGWQQRQWKTQKLRKQGWKFQKNKTEELRPQKTRESKEAREEEDCRQRTSNNESLGPEPGAWSSNATFWALSHCLSKPRALFFWPEYLDLSYSHLSLSEWLGL